MQNDEVSRRLNVSTQRKSENEFKKKYTSAGDGINFFFYSIRILVLTTRSFFFATDRASRYGDLKSIKVSIYPDRKFVRYLMDINVLIIVSSRTPFDNAPGNQRRFLRSFDSNSVFAKRRDN